jgi:hypothetical protein
MFSSFLKPSLTPVFATNILMMVSHAESIFFFPESRGRLCTQQNGSLGIESQSDVDEKETARMTSSHESKDSKEILSPRILRSKVKQ